MSLSSMIRIWDAKWSLSMTWFHNNWVDISIESLRQLILSRETNTQKTTVNLLTDLVRGFISIVLTNSLKRKIKGSNNKKSILRAIIDGIQEVFFNIFENLGVKGGSSGRKWKK